MTTGRGLSADRLWAACWPFLSAIYAHGDEESDAAYATRWVADTHTEVAFNVSAHPLRQFARSK